MRTRKNSGTSGVHPSARLAGSVETSLKCEETPDAEVPAKSNRQSVAPGFMTHLRPAQCPFKSTRKNAAKTPVFESVELSHDLLVKILGNLKDGVKADAPRGKKSSGYLAAKAIAGAPMLVNKAFKEAARAVAKGDPDVARLIGMQPILWEFSLLGMETNKAAFKKRITDNLLCAAEINIPFSKLNKWQAAMTLGVLKSMAESSKISHMQKLQFDFSDTNMPLKLAGDTVEALRRMGQLSRFELNISDAMVDSGDDIPLLRAVKSLDASCQLTLKNSDFSFARASRLSYRLLAVAHWSVVDLDGHRHASKNAIRTLAQQYDTRLREWALGRASATPAGQRLTSMTVPPAARRFR